MLAERNIAYKLRESHRMDEFVNQENVGPEDLEEAGAFQTIHYEVASKKTGKTFIKNFGYFTDEEGFWKTMDKEYPKNLYIVTMVKPKKMVRESEEVEETEPFTHEEETETPEDLLKEDWRSGTFTSADADKYCKKTLEEVGRILFSIQSLEKKHGNDPDVMKKLKQLRQDIKSKF